MSLLRDAKAGEIIRKRDTRECWLIISKSAHGLMVINLMQKMSPALIMMVLPSQSDDWQRDIEIDDLEEWEVKELNKKMSLVEEIQNE